MFIVRMRLLGNRVNTAAGGDGIVVPEKKQKGLRQLRALGTAWWEAHGGELHDGKLHGGNLHGEDFLASIL